MKNLTLKKSFLILLGVFLLAGFAFFFVSSQKPDKTQVNQGLSFHPDAVQRLSWMAEREKFDFTRASRNEAWQPEVDSNLVSKKLILLSSPSLTKMNIPQGRLKVIVGFQLENDWEGVYDDDQFVWTKGLYAGFGFQVSDAGRALFEEGRFAFKKHSWQWCRKRPQSVTIKAFGKETRLFSVQNRWLLERSGKKQEVDSTNIEKWLGRYCEVVVEVFRDLKEFPLTWSMASEFVEIQFADNEQIKVKRHSQFWQVDETMAIQSQEWEQALKEILATP